MLVFAGMFAAATLIPYYTQKLMLAFRLQQQPGKKIHVADI